MNSLFSSIACTVRAFKENVVPLLTHCDAEMAKDTERKTCLFKAHAVEFFLDQLLCERRLRRTIGSWVQLADNRKFLDGNQA